MSASFACSTRRHGWLHLWKTHFLTLEGERDGDERVWECMPLKMDPGMEMRARKQAICIDSLMNEENRSESILISRKNRHQSTSVTQWRYFSTVQFSMSSLILFLGLGSQKLRVTRPTHQIQAHLESPLSPKKQRGISQEESKSLFLIMVMAKFSWGNKVTSKLYVKTNSLIPQR